MARGIQAVWLIVEDLAKSTAFYRMLLDREPSATFEGKGGSAERTTCFELGDGTRLMLWFDPGVALAMSEMVNPARLDIDLEVEDVRALWERLVRSGFDPLTQPGDNELGGQTFDVRDPDGNRIRLGDRWATPIANL